MADRKTEEVSDLQIIEHVKALLRYCVEELEISPAVSFLSLQAASQFLEAKFNIELEEMPLTNSPDRGANMLQ
jgi:hypothetical protein